MSVKTDSERRILVQALLFATLFVVSAGIQAFASSEEEPVIEQILEDAKEELIRSRMVLNLQHRGFHWYVTNSRSGRSWKVVADNAKVKELIGSLNSRGTYRCETFAIFTAEEVRLTELKTCKGILHSDSLRR